MTDEEWITLRQAIEILGFEGNDWVRRMCREGRLQARKVSYRGDIRQWLVLKADIEELAKERAFEAQMKAEGKKRCPGCGEWKDRKAGFWRSGRSGRCRSCVKEQRKSPHREAGSWGWERPARPMGGDLLDYIGSTGGKPRAEDSLKYACMDKGFYHRPVPDGMTKRQAFCAVCTAGRCVHYSDKTPEQLCQQARVEWLPAGMTAASGG